MAQSVRATWDALYTALQGLFPASDGWLVSAGDPGDYQPDLIVAMMGVHFPSTQPTLATSRPRDQRFQIDLVISVYVAGGVEAQQPANDAAFDAADVIVDYFRTSPNEKLGGACYNATVTQGDLTPSVSWERPDPSMDAIPAGRIADIALTVEAWVRR